MRILIVTCAAFLGGCVVAQTVPDQFSDAIRPSTLEMVQNCEYLGPVDSFAGPIYGGLRAANTIARNKTVDLGGDTIVVSSSETDRRNIGRVSAGAYRCN